MTDQERIHSLDVLSTAFLEHARGLGVEESVLGIIIPFKDAGWEARVRVNGNSSGLVNLICALIEQLIPDDFQTLLNAMQNAPNFAMQRVPDQPVAKRHVN